MRPGILSTALLAALIGGAAIANLANAAEGDGSLDPMWTDPGVTIKTSGVAADQASASAPMCSLEALKQSELMKKGGWPGIGPFKPDGSEYVDPGQNRLKFESSKDKVTSAELRLNNQAKSTALFNLEMTADFLLESLGAKAARISDFNGQLEKSKAKLLTSSETSPLNLCAGSYLVDVHPEPEKSGPDKYAFIIHISSKDASSDLLKHVSAGAPNEPTETGWQAHTSAPAVAVATLPKISTTKTVTERAPVNRPPLTSTAPSLNFGIETGVSKSPVKSAPATTAKSSAETTSVTAVTTTASTAATTSSPPQPATAPETVEATGNQTAPVSLKDTFRDVINGWQKLKKVAVRQKDTSELSTVLSGRALVRQSDAIKWLVANHKYYDMNPKGTVVDRFVELNKGQKYAVYAQVREASKYIDEPTGQVIKDSDDVYNVNYTIEKVADKWLISDSAIVNPPGKPAKSK